MPAPAEPSLLPAVRKPLRLAKVGTVVAVLPMILTCASMVPRIPPDWTNRVSVALTKDNVVVPVLPMENEFTELLPATSTVEPLTRMLFPAAKAELPKAGWF